MTAIRSIANRQAEQEFTTLGKLYNFWVIYAIVTSRLIWSDTMY